MSRNILNKTSIDVFIKNINMLIDKYGGPVAFSKKIEAGYHAVLYWSKGKNLPDGKTLLKIHEKCGISIDLLLTGKDSTGFKCLHCGDWSNEIRDACADVKEILESDDEAVRTALQSNLAAFKQSIEKNKRLHKARLKDNMNPGKRARDKSTGSHSDTGPAAKSAVG